MANPKPELIELLINEAVNNPDNYVNVINRARPQGFAEHFALILEDTPQAHSTLKPEFFLHFFLGSILSLPNTSLMSKLNIEDILFKLDKKNYQSVKLVFKIHEQERYKLKLILINTSADSGNIGFTREELVEIKSELLGSSSNIVATEIDGQILHITRDAGFKLKILPELSHQEFITVPSFNSNVNPTFHKVRKDIVQEIDIDNNQKRILQAFDPLLAKLSNDDISSVHKNTEDIFVLLKKIYTSYHQDQLGASESSYHGYIYGFFRLNYKYKYELDCYVERIAGKGYADLVLLSRNNDNGNNNQQTHDVTTSHKHQNTAPQDQKQCIPIIVELKAGVGAQKAIEQIHESGYIYNLPNIRTNAKEAVIVGVDFSAEDDLKVQTLKINAAASNLISQLVKDVYVLNNKYTKIFEDIYEAIKYLYYSSIKSKDNHYLSRVLLGQAFTSKDHSNDNKGQLNKHVFLYNKDGKLTLIGDRVTTIILQQDSKGIILNIIEGSNTHYTRFKSKKQDRSFDDSKILPVENLAIQDLIIINISVNPKGKIFAEGTEGTDKSYLQKITVEQKNINEFRAHQKYQGHFQTLRNVQVQDLINLIYNLDSNVDSDHYIPFNKKKKVVDKDLQQVLLECVSPIKDFIKQESDLQAIIQGMFINQRLPGGKQIKIFSEVSCGSGRVDLALSIVDKDFQEDKPILMELKYGSNNELMDKAEKQLSTYSQYLKSATTFKEVQNVAIVYRNNKENNFLQVKISSKKIEHTSQSSDNVQDSSNKGSVSKRVKKVLHSTDLKFLSQIKTIDNDVLLDFSYGTNNKRWSEQSFAKIIEFLDTVVVSSSAKITLSIAGHHINDAQATKLFQVLEKKIAINSLDISSTNLNKELLKQLIGVLKKKEDLTISEPLSLADQLSIIKNFAEDLSIDYSIKQVYQHKARQLLDELRAIEHFPIGSKGRDQTLAKIYQLLPDLSRIQDAINIRSSKLAKIQPLLDQIQAIQNLPISSEEKNQHLVNTLIPQQHKVSFSSLQRLDLSNNPLGIEVAPILKDALERLDGLEEINLSNNPIGDVGLESIAQGLKQNYAIKILKLSNIGITKIQELSKILNKKMVILELDLSDNQLSNSEIKVLLDDLTKENAIHKLNLSKLNLANANILASLANFIATSSSLQELNLSNTGLGNEGLELITPSLRNNNLNLFLDISYNKISNADILFQSLNPAYYANVLTGLVLADNEISQVTALSDALIGNKKLQYLDIANNQITFEQATYIFFSLRPLDDGTAQNNILNTLILSNNPIRIDLSEQDGFNDLQNMLSHNDGLTHLALSKTAIDDNLFTKILSSLQENTRLESIDLSDNQIEITDHRIQDRIRELLRENTVLSELNLANNKITDKGGKIIISSFFTKEIMNKQLAKRTEFLDLDLSGNPSLGKEFIARLIDIIKGEYPIDNLRLTNNNWSEQHTTPLINAIVNSKAKKVNIDLSGNQISMYNQELLNDYRAKITLQILDDDLQNSIIANCLPSTSKSKRSINECKIGWSDVDAISKDKTRNVEKVVLDAVKIFRYSKTIHDQSALNQLVAVIKAILTINNHNIVNIEQYLSEDFIENRHHKDSTLIGTTGFDKLKYILELMHARDKVKQITQQGMLDYDYNSVLGQLKQHAYQLGIDKDQFTGLENHLDITNEEIYDKYIGSIITELQKNQIHFDQDKFDTAKSQGAKTSKLLSILAIYDLFDTIIDHETFGRHNNNALKKVFGVSAILDTINDLRISLDISNQNKLIGKTIDRIPKIMRTGLVHIIDNPIIGGITFIGNAWQFGYSINEITEGNHNILNYYWTGSSGIKLSTPIIGIPRVYQLLGIASKIISKISLMTTVADIALVTGMKIHERLKVLEYIASRLPLSGVEKRELFFAEIIKFFQDKDIEKEYIKNDKIRLYLDGIKTKAKLLLEQDNSIAAIVQYVAGIEEQYHEIITEGEFLHEVSILFGPTQQEGIWCHDGKCKYREELYNYYYTPVHDKKIQSNLSSLDISQTLPLTQHILDIHKTIKGLKCSITPRNFGCKVVVENDEINDREIYIIDFARKYIPYITKSEYEDWGLRVVSVPSGTLQYNSSCNIINDEKTRRVDAGSIILNDYYQCHVLETCNVGKNIKDCHNSSTFLDEIQPFIFTNIKKPNPYNRKHKHYTSNSILYFSGPKTLVAAQNYPAVMYIAENMNHYYGSKLHETIGIINNIPISGILEGGEVEKNMVMISNDVNNVTLNIDFANCHISSIQNSCLQGYLALKNMYNYLSYSNVEQIITTSCKTRYINAAESDMGNKIYQLKFSTTINDATYNDTNCTSEDYEIRVLHNKDQHYTGPKRIIFLLNKYGGHVEITYNKYVIENKSNIDVISLQEDGDITKQITVSYDKVEEKFNLLINNRQNITTYIKVNSFHKLVIQGLQPGYEQLIMINYKSLLHILEDMKYQIFYKKLGAGISGDTSIVTATISVSKNINSVSQMYDAYNFTKDIMNGNSLSIPIQVALLEQRYLSVPMSKTLIGGIYSDSIAVDFNDHERDIKNKYNLLKNYNYYHNISNICDYIHKCNYYQMITVEGGAGQDKYIFRLPIYDNIPECINKIGVISLYLDISNEDKWYQGISNDIVDLSILNITNVNTLKVSKHYEHIIANHCFTDLTITNVVGNNSYISNIIFDSDGLQWSLLINLVDYWSSPTYQHIIFKFNDSNNNYKIDDTGSKLELIEDISIVHNNQPDTTTPQYVNDQEDTLGLGIVNHQIQNNKHRHRHHHGENAIDHRGRRDIDHSWHVFTKDGNNDHDNHLLDARDDIFAVRNAGSSLKPLGDTIVNWIRDSILLFKTLNPIRQVKNLFNAYNDKTKTIDLDISDDVGCKESQKQDGLINKFSIVQEINDQICALVEKKVAAEKLLRALCQQLNNVEKDMLIPKELEYTIINIYQEEENLVIKQEDAQDKKQELYHIKEQIESQKSVIENLRGTLNSLNHELAMLNVEDNNLSLYHELPYWNKSLEEDVEVDDDIADQVPIWIRSNQHINVGNLPNSFIGNDRDKNQVLDDSLCDFQGTLSLWNLLMRKKYGVHYNHQHDIMQSEEVNAESAHRLAYEAYASIYDTSQENIGLSGISMVA